MNSRLFLVTYSNPIRRKDLIKLLGNSILTWMTHNPNSLFIITSPAYNVDSISDILIRYIKKRKARYTVVELDIKGGNTHGVWPQQHLDILDSFNLRN